MQNQLVCIPPQAHTQLSVICTLGFFVCVGGFWDFFLGFFFFGHFFI